MSKFINSNINLIFIFISLFILGLAPKAIAIKGEAFRSPFELPNSSGLKNQNTTQNYPESVLLPESFLHGPFFQGIKFFRTFISPADGDRCPMFPSCSEFATEAFRDYGLIKGCILTSDRLLRCGRETDYPLVHHHGRLLFYDPLKRESGSLKIDP